MATNCNRVNRTCQHNFVCVAAIRNPCQHNAVMLSTQSVNMRQMWPQSAPCVNIVEVHSSFAHAANEAEIITSGTLSVRGNTALHWQCQPRNLETETVEKPMNLRATQAVCVPTFLLIFKESFWHIQIPNSLLLDPWSSIQ